MNSASLPFFLLLFSYRNDSTPFFPRASLVGLAFCPRKRFAWLHIFQGLDLIRCRSVETSSIRLFGVIERKGANKRYPTGRTYRRTLEN